MAKPLRINTCALTPEQKTYVWNHVRALYANKLKYTLHRHDLMTVAGLMLTDVYHTGGEYPGDTDIHLVFPSLYVTERQPNVFFPPRVVVELLQPFTITNKTSGTVDRILFHPVMLLYIGKKCYLFNIYVESEWCDTTTMKLHITVPGLEQCITLWFPPEIQEIKAGQHIVSQQSSDSKHTEKKDE